MCVISSDAIDLDVEPVCRQKLLVDVVPIRSNRVEVFLIVTAFVVLFSEKLFTSWSYL